jgi:hypothetical protein
MRTNIRSNKDRREIAQENAKALIFALLGPEDAVRWLVLQIRLRQIEVEIAELELGVLSPPRH